MHKLGRFTFLEHPHQIWQMCQMPNIWHICHIKHKNEALSNVPNSKNYTTSLQYCLKYETVRIDFAKKINVLYSLFSLLSFHFFFSLLSHSPGPSLFDQSRMFIGSDNSVAPMTTTRPTTLDQPCLISPTLDLSNLTSRPPSISPPSLSSLSAFHSTSLWLWVFFFFLLQFGLWWQVVVQLIWVVVVRGLWAVTVAVVVGCGGDDWWWLSMLLMIIGEGIIYYFNV